MRLMFHYMEYSCEETKNFLAKKLLYISICYDMNTLAVLSHTGHI